MKTAFIALSLVALLASCSKEGGDRNAPNITITSPANHQSFTAGQRITASADITDDDQIHQTHIYVINKATSAELFHVEQHPDIKSCTVLQSFTPPAGIYKIEVHADDHAGNAAKAEIEVTVN